MKQKSLQVALGVAFGIYLYEVIGNFYDKLNFSAALLHVDWLRIAFVGLFSMVVVGLLNRRKQNN